MADTGSANDPAGGDWLDVALRAHRLPPLADDGFAARVMAALPPPVAAVAPAWRQPVVALLWVLSAIGIALSLPNAALDVVREAYRVFTAIPVSVPQLAFAVVALAAVTWSVAAYAVRRELVPG
ncbi:MAG TPA: hypothetical protein VGR63_01440 [Casimicrobiaceae bacterium]|jgi:hypothetical protein|nr:hypothetical protein [Casimicrobiaceae bacterium]